MPELKEFTGKVSPQIMSILGETTVTQSTEVFPIVPFQWETTPKRWFHKCPNPGRVSLATRFEEMEQITNCAFVKWPCANHLFFLSHTRTPFLALSVFHPLLSFTTCIHIYTYTYIYILTYLFGELPGRHSLSHTHSLTSSWSPSLSLSFMYTHVYMCLHTYTDRPVGWACACATNCYLSFSHTLSSFLSLSRPLSIWFYVYIHTHVYTYTYMHPCWMSPGVDNRIFSLTSLCLLSVLLSLSAFSLSGSVSHFFYARIYIHLYPSIHIDVDMDLWTYI